LDQQAPDLRRAGGHRSFKDLAPGRIEVSSATPSRCSISRGYFSGVAEYFGQMVTVEHVEGACRDRGGTECRYLLVWNVSQ
jgi:hypothetical protein